MPNPTATIFVPYHALNEAIDDPTIARTNEPNVFTEDQTIEGNLIVTGEINPARWAEQRPKIEQLEGRIPGTPGGVRTLLSETLTAGMSLRHDDAAHVAKITVGNYDTQTYQPLLLEANSVRLVTGVFPPGLEEHLRVHPSGGVTVGAGTAHATDPGTGVLVAAAGLGTTPIPVATVGPVAAAHLVGRGSAGAGLLEPITVGAGLVLQGTTLSALSSSVFAYQFSTAVTEPPSNQTIRFNASYPYTAVTKVWADYDSSASEDLYWAWQRVQIGSLLLVQDKDNHQQWGEVRTTGAPLDRGNYVELPCVWASNGTALATQDVLVRVTLTTVGLLARLDALEARVAALEGGR